MCEVYKLSEKYTNMTNGIEKELENLNGPITIKKADLVVKSLFLPQWKGPVGFSLQFRQMLFPVVIKPFQKK